MDRTCGGTNQLHLLPLPRYCYASFNNGRMLLYDNLSSAVSVLGMASLLTLSHRHRVM